ncbi:MAG: phosphoribosyltransferase [Saprospiraceae bacterium]|nr:phosphoribosyltransferase [Saprospiraceae bacterium]
MKILNQHQIEQKIRRLAIEILENNYEETELILAGINNNGYAFAALLLEDLQKISPIRFTLTRIRLNPAHPTEFPVQTEMPVEAMAGKVVIIVDDVANTGRTIFYACKPLLDALPKRLEVAVLVDRKHKNFPIRADYVGIALNTTLKNDIDVQIREVEEWGAFLS